MDGAEENVDLRPNPALLRYVDQVGRHLRRSSVEVDDPTGSDQPSPIVDVGNDVPGTDFP